MHRETCRCGRLSLQPISPHFFPLRRHYRYARRARVKNKSRNFPVGDSDLRSDSSARERDSADGCRLLINQWLMHASFSTVDSTCTDAVPNGRFAAERKLRADCAAGSASRAGDESASALRLSAGVPRLRVSRHNPATPDTACNRRRASCIGASVNREEEAESADKPGSVEDSHSSGIARHRRPQAAYPEALRGTRAATCVRFPIWPCSRWGLPCRRVLPPARCALTAPFHPYRASLLTLRRFAFCCTFRRLAPPRRYLAPCPVEPGLSSTFRENAATVWPTPARTIAACRARSQVASRRAGFSADLRLFASSSARA